MCVCVLEGGGGGRVRERKYMYVFTLSPRLLKTGRFLLVSGGCVCVSVCVGGGMCL